MAIDSLFKGIRDPQEHVISTTQTLPSGGNQHFDVDTSGGAVVATLPPAAENAWQFISVRKIGGGTNTLTVAGVTGSGAGTTGLATMEDDSDNAIFLSNGIIWMTLAQYVAD